MSAKSYVQVLSRVLLMMWMTIWFVKTKMNLKERRALCKVQLILMETGILFRRKSKNSAASDTTLKLKSVFAYIILVKYSQV